MKQIKIYLAGIFLLGIIVIACRKNETETIGGSANRAAERIKTRWKSTSNPVTIDPNDPIEIQALEQFAGYDFSSTPPNNEYDASVMLAPLMTNSLQYFHDMGLSDADLLEEFSSLNDYRLAYVAFAMQRLDLENGSTLGCNSSNLAIRCLISSLLPCEIMDFFTGTIRDKLTEFGFTVAFNALSMSAKKAILKAIGARAAGFIGGGGAMALAFFIYDFTTCMLHGTDTPEPGPGPRVQYKYLTTLDQLGYGLPILTWPTTLDYVVNASDLTALTPYIPTSSPVYLNTADNKYYSDSNFTTFVPDGFYDVQANMTLMHYFRIINGESVMAYELHQ